MDSLLKLEEHALVITQAMWGAAKLLAVHIFKLKWIHLCLINDKFIVQVKWVDGQNGVHVQLPVMMEFRPEPGNALHEDLQKKHTIWLTIAMVNFMRVGNVINGHVKGILVSGQIGVHVQQLVAMESGNERETAMEQ